jgi:anti-sigma28 factor (negative regulator of flagellin synthesis)
MTNKKEWMVPMTPIRNADCSARSAGQSQAASLPAARVTELRQQVRNGYYATDSMMDAVARLIYLRGDL